MTTHKEALTLALEMVQNYMYAHAEMYLKEALAQPEQEPVAVVDANDDGYWADILPDKDVKVGQHLYTTPPQRTWVGLTDVEINEIWASQNKTGEQITRDIEAKLKEKNT